MKRLKGIARRKKRIKRGVVGTDKRPRLSVSRSHKNICVQLVDDMKGHTLLSLSTSSAEMKNAIKYGGNVKAASVLGETVAKKALSKGISKVIFDRAGHLYHGRVKALAEGARKGGLLF